MKVNLSTVIGTTAIALSFFTASVSAQVDTLATRAGNEIGLAISSYKYDEPADSQQATQWSIAYTGTQTISDGWFVRGNLNYAYGKTDYSSTGTGSKNGNSNWHYEIRAVAGKDIPFGNCNLSPYLGLAYRHLFNDLRGRTSAGAIGYRRESNYYALPIGVNHRINLGNNVQLFTTIEYDHLLLGRQDTKLSDLIGHDGFSSASDISNTQHHGYGWRLSSMVQSGKWSIGPYLTIWRINDSAQTTATAVRNGVSYQTPLWEPANSTTEYGVKASYRF
jgi:hypothetical protein